MRTFVGIAIAALLASSCGTNQDTKTHPSEGSSQMRTQELGESVEAYWFEGEGSAEMPDDSERLAFHFLNLGRIYPELFDIRDPMTGELFPPKPPLIYQVSMTETGRWQGRHALEYSCLCPQSGMEEPAAFNSCCELGYRDGQVTCLGPIVGCGDEGSTEQHDRWSLLNRGPGEIDYEFYLTSTDQEAGDFGFWAASQAIMMGGPILHASRYNTGGVSLTSMPVVPEECVEEEDPCGAGGNCVDENGEDTCASENPNDCLGTCEGGAMAGDSCVVPAGPDPDVCTGDYPRAFYWSFLFGRTSEPHSYIIDAAHYQNEVDESPVITFASNYHDELGEPQRFEIVVDDTCTDLEFAFTDLHADPERPWNGAAYAATFPVGSLADGCHKYFFEATDAEGFVHRYPTYGALQAKLADGGQYVANDETCPIWTPEPPAASCLPTIDACDTGDTRPCYTGRAGTQDKGICGAGTETCTGGRWSGLCEGETRPASEDTCDDELDNNCNGVMNEGCPVVVDPEADAGGTDEPDAGTSPGDDAGSDGEVDAGMQPEPDAGAPPSDKKEEPGGGCCATVTTPERPYPLLALAALLFGAALLRRRR